MFKVLNRALSVSRDPLNYLKTNIYPDLKSVEQYRQWLG